MAKSSKIKDFWDTKNQRFFSASTSEIERVNDPKTFKGHKQASREGGNVAKTARLKLESRTKRKVITNENYLEKPESQKKIESKKNKN